MTYIHLFPFKYESQSHHQVVNKVAPLNAFEEKKSIRVKIKEFMDSLGVAIMLSVLTLFYLLGVFQSRSQNYATGYRPSPPTSFGSPCSSYASSCSHWNSSFNLSCKTATNSAYSFGLTSSQSLVSSRTLTGWSMISRSFSA